MIESPARVIEANGSVLPGSFFSERNSYLIILSVVVCYIVFFLIWTSIIVPILTSIPSNFSYRADIVSRDNFYSEEGKEYQGEIVSAAKFSFEAGGATKGSLLIKNLFDVRTPNGQKIFAVERFYGIDPKTGMHSEGGDRERNGYLFAPRNLDKQPFTYWHVNYDAPARLAYAGTENLFGLKVYRYETDYHADQTAELGFLPEVGKSRGVNLDINLKVWIEPVSGWMVKYQDNSTAYYYDLQTKERLNPWNHFTNTYSEDSVREQVKNAEGEKNKLNLAGRDVPLFVGLGGIMFLLFLIFRSNIFSVKRLANLTVPFWSIAPVSIFTGIVVILGWIFDVKILTQIFPIFSPMNPVTALCFILIGISFFFVGKPHLKLPGIVCAVSVLIIGFLRISSIYFGLGFNIDLILFSDKMLAPNSAPSRMVVITALSFIMTGLTLLSLSLPFLKQFKISKILPMIVAFFGLSGIVSYFFNGSLPLTLAVFFSVALQTGFLFFFMGIFLSIYSEEIVSMEIPVGLILKRMSFLIVFLIPIMLTFSATKYAEQTLHARLQTKFNEEAETIEREIKQRIEIYKNALEGSRGFINSSEKVTRNEWKVYTAQTRVLQNYPGIEGIGYAEYLDSEETRKDHISRMKEDGIKSYIINSQEESSVNIPITYLEPQTDENVNLLGFDLWSEDIRRKALIASLESGVTLISDKIGIIQSQISGENSSEFLMVLPVYKNGELTSTLARRRKAIAGFVIASFHIKDLMDSVSTESTTTSFDILEGIDANSKESLLYSSNKNQSSLELVFQPQFIKSKTIYALGHPWTLSVYSQPGFQLNSSEESIPTIIVLSGLAISVLLFSVFYSLLNSRARATAYANQATKDLLLERASLKEANITVEARDRELAEKVTDLEATNKVMVDRELKMIELKNKIRELENK